MIAKRTSLGGGAYETSFALGVAGAPSSTASRVSRNAPLSRTQSHEFSASLGYLVPFSRNVLQQRCPIVPLTRHISGWSFSMSWKETYSICLCSFCGLSKRDAWRSSTVSWKSFSRSATTIMESYTLHNNNRLYTCQCKWPQISSMFTHSLTQKHIVLWHAPDISERILTMDWTRSMFSLLCRRPEVAGHTLRNYPGSKVILIPID